jgi:hypothetical protein
MKAYWGNEGIAPRILDLVTRWRWVVTFTTRPLYSQGKSPRYPLVRRLGGPQSQSGTQWWREKSPAPAGIQTADHPASSPALYRWAILALPYTLCVAQMSYFDMHWKIFTNVVVMNPGSYFGPTIWFPPLPPGIAPYRKLLTASQSYQRIIHNHPVTSHSTLKQ